MINTKFLPGIVLILAGLILSACAPGATAAPTTTPTSDGGPPPPTGVNQAQIELSEQLGISSEEIVVEEWEAVEWQDSCLGLGRANESCAQVIVPGYRAVLLAEGQQYMAHTDQEGDQVRFENQPFSPEETIPPLGLGEFPLEFYDLVLRYDATLWTIEPGEGNFDVLSYSQIDNCFIREQGPTEPPPVESTATLGGIVYDIYERSENGNMFRWYLAREGFDNPDPGTIPIFVLTAPEADAQACISAAEEVLATLERSSPP